MKKKEAEALPVPVAPTTIEEFGAVFPANWSEFQRRAACALHGVGTTPIWEHRRAIIQMLWPDQVDSWNVWTDRRIRSLSKDSFTIWIGAGSTWKTSDAARMAVEYWIEAPDKTGIIVCSTTKEMLRARIWGQIIHHWNRLPSWITYKGQLNDTDCTIRWEDGDKKHVIHGIAVQEGPEQEAIDNIIGLHPERYMLILDEMQGVRPAIMSAAVLANLRKNAESKFLGMGNPSSLLCLLCKFAEPLNGWSSVVAGETEEWEINSQGFLGRGRTLFFNGLKSPAILDPEWGKRYPTMISQAQVDADRELLGEDNPAFWTQTVGWPPPSGTENTVLDMAIIEKFECREKAKWTDGFQQGAALDPAFSEGGDRKILQFFRFGLTSYATDEARWVIELGEWFDVPINVKSPAPIEDQLALWCKEKCESKGIKATEFAVDSTGIGRGTLNSLRREFGAVVAIEFGGGPSHYSAGNGRMARDVFDNRTSELNGMVREFAAANGLRGLSEKAMRQGCSRRTLHGVRGSKYHVESKKEYKKRMGHSPDHFDAVCIAVGLARERGAVPGRKTAGGPTTEESAVKVIESDRYFSEETLAEHEDWSVEQHEYVL